jgi:hypothetical protein
MVEFPFDFALSLVAFLSAAQHGVFGAGAVMPRLQVLPKRRGRSNATPSAGRLFFERTLFGGSGTGEGKKCQPV